MFLSIYFVIESGKDLKDGIEVGATFSNPISEEDEDCSLRRGGRLIGDTGAAGIIAV